MPEINLHDSSVGGGWSTMGGFNGMNYVMKIVPAALAVSSASAASGQVVSNAAGVLLFVVVTTAGSAAAGSTTNFYDNASAASGTVIGTLPGNAGTGTYTFNYGVFNGVYASGSTNGPAFTAYYGKAG